MTKGKRFLDFWTTFPGVLTGAGVLMLATLGLIVIIISFSISSSLISCAEFQRGREDQVACNATTEPGFFWSLVSKTEHYSVEGVSPVGGEPQCGTRSVGVRAMSARFPLHDSAFLPVKDFYENKHPDLTAPGCNFSPAGEQETDRDLGAICGIFVFECNEQPL